MNENITKRNELLAQKVIKGLESRNMTGYYAANKEEALKKALEFYKENRPVVLNCIIPEDDKVFPMSSPGAPLTSTFDASDL